MAAEAITPVDEIGMPLPLAPSSIDASPDKDWHHHFHPRRSLLLTQTLGGQAVREVRLQLADRGVHHDDYHGNYIGPPLPQTPAEQFGIVVLASAGYVPAHALSFDKEKPDIIKLSGDQRRQLWESGDLRMASSHRVRRFLLDYILSQDLTDINETMVDEFLNTINPDRRYHLGGKLIGLAIETATEPIGEFYRRAWRRGLINPKNSHRIRRVVKNRVSYRFNNHQLVDMLEERLAA